jgi:hypothetical protein
MSATVGTTDTDRRREAALAQIAEYSRFADASLYYIAQGAALLADLGYTAKAICEEVAEQVGPTPLKSAPQVSKYLAWARLGDSPEVRALGVTRAYSLRGKQGWEADAAQAVSLGTWEAFDAKWLGKKPIVEVGEKCVCPHCGALHQKKGGKE